MPPQRATHQQQQSRRRTVTLLTFAAAAAILLLAALQPSRRRVSGTMLRTTGLSEMAMGDDDTATATDSGSGGDTARLLKRKGASALWSRAAVPKRPALLRGDAGELCGLLAPPEAGSIAVVGNGPLTDASRADIAAADHIVRFNELNNRLPGERLDVWFVRHNYRQPVPYWGFWQMQNDTRRVMGVIEQATAVLLLGGTKDSAQPLLEAYPTLPAKAFQADTREYQQRYRKFFAGALGEQQYPPDPSTGLLGLIQLLACLKPDRGRKGRPAVDVYGFNWSPMSWTTHQMAAEEVIVMRLTKPWGVTFHATACDGLRACEELCDQPEFQIAEHGDGEDCRQWALGSEGNGTERGGAGTAAEPDPQKFDMMP